ncbi:peptidoglycan DD-metalloendopeptidase family protein [Salicola sp. Rm-C-2C1-2]|uniref:M23 family metallopeptidase n=1 Tax=Salicola sp. Rm-C-2C1-2 TaxID=3141321 RepID=UPI0032E3B871
MLRQFPGTHIAALAGLTALVGLTLLVSPGSNQSQTTKTFDVAPIPTHSREPRTENQQYTQTSMVTPAQTLARTPAPDLQNILGVNLQTVPVNEPSTATASRDDGIREQDLSWQRFRIERGDSLSTLFGQAGLNDRAMYRILNGEGKPDQLARLRIGREIEFGFDDSGELAMVVLHNSPTTKLKAVRHDDGFHTHEEMRDPEIELAYASGEIQTSYILAANRAGLKTKVRNKLSRIFGWRVDFSRDLRKGDRFGVLYEKQYLDGEMIGHGRILAATFTNRGETYSAALYTDADGNSDYYTPEGESLRKAFLRTPLQYQRISSHFDMNRRHPILNRVRPHEGTDFAASPGTPVKASGEGRVTYVGRDGGYGKTVRIDHGNEITTVYSHLRSYKRGIRRGQTVQQGDVIAYVGMSGLATGPHLHYEYRVSGQPRNPLHVNLPDADPIPEDRMAQFRAQTNPRLAQLSEEDKSFQIALAEE